MLNPDEVRPPDGGVVGAADAAESVLEVDGLKTHFFTPDGVVRAVEILRRVHIPEPERRAHSYPHQLSGGMRQG